jgi:hypothetical protein
MVRVLVGWTTNIINYLPANTGTNEVFVNR